MSVIVLVEVRALWVVGVQRRRVGAGAALYFLVVLPFNKLHERMARGEEPEPETPSQEVQLLTQIRDALVDGRVPDSDRAPVRPGEAG